MKTFKLLRGYYNDDPPASPPVVPPPPPSPPPAVPPGAKVYTQAQLDEIFANQRKELQKKNQDMAAELERLSQSNRLTAEEKEALATQVTNLNQQHLTEKDKLQQQVEQANKKAKADADKLTADRDHWLQSHNKLLIKNAIISGAAKHQAASDKQLLLMLQGQAKVVEDQDSEGKPIPGQYVAKLPMPVVDKATKAVTIVDMLIDDAIGELKKNPEYQNLFLVDGKPGFGGLGNAGGNSGTPSTYQPGTNPADYRKQRSGFGLK